MRLKVKTLDVRAQQGPKGTRTRPSRGVRIKMSDFIECDGLGDGGKSTRIRSQIKKRVFQNGQFMKKN